MAAVSAKADKVQRFAELAAALAGAARRGEVRDVDALRVLRHELRRMNVNKAASIPVRSVAAAASVIRHNGKPPKNGSGDALHCDHVYRLMKVDLDSWITVGDWLGRMDRFMEVVCVTADENYKIETFERQGASGFEKYELANVVMRFARDGCSGDPSRSSR